MKMWNKVVAGFAVAVLVAALAPAVALAVYPPATHETKTWTLAPDEQGNYADCPAQEEGYFVMPGDKVTFQTYAQTRTATQSTPGGVFEHQVTEETIGFVPSSESTARHGVSFGTPQTAACTTTKADGTQETASMDFYNVIENKSTYGLYIVIEGDAQTISGATYGGDYGQTLSEEYKRVKGIGIQYYVVEQPASWDITASGLEPDATLQGADDPNSSYPVFYAGDVPNSFSVNNPVAKGKHFYGWDTTGLAAVVEASTQVGEDGRSTTTFDYTPTYCPQQWAAEDSSASQLTASWSNGYTITYHGNGGTVNGLDEWIYEAHEDESSGAWDTSGLTTAPKRSGYTFAGWYYVDTTSDEKTKLSFTSLNAPYNGPDWYGVDSWQAWMLYNHDGVDNALNLDVYAKWTQEKVTTTKLTVSKKKVKLAKKGKKATVAVAVKPATSKTGESIKVKNGNKKVASVKFNAKTGKLKVTAKKKGTCKITVTCGSKKATVTVTVKK